MRLSRDHVAATPHPADTAPDSRLPLGVAVPFIGFMSVALWVAIWQGVSQIF